MKFNAIAILAVAVFASAIAYSTTGNGGEPVKSVTVKSKPLFAKKVAPDGQIALSELPKWFKPFKVGKGLVIGEVTQSSIGKVIIYDNGKGYRWAEQVETPFIYTYNYGETQKVVLPRSDTAPQFVTTKTWGIVYADPRLVTEY